VSTLTAAIVDGVKAEMRAADQALKLTGLGDLLAEPDDAIEWIIEDRVSYGSVNLLAGKPKAGKSTLARYLAFCVGTGTPFLGNRTICGPVWYLVLEDKRSEVRRHFRNLGATGNEPIRFLFGNQPELLAKLTQLAERERPLVVVVDTLQRFISAKDLNDYAEVTTKLTPIIALARSTGAALVLVHHAGKAERAGIDTVLGSTALAGSVDNIFLVNRTDRYRLLSSVQRIGSDLPETVLVLDDGTGRLHAGQSRHEADVLFIETAMVSALQNADHPLTQAEWLEACEGRRQLKLEALRRLVNSGTTIRSGAGGKADPYRYQLSPGSGSGSEVPLKSREPQSSLSLLSDSLNESAQDSGSQVPGVRQEQSDADRL
jgi:AAA domain